MSILSVKNTAPQTAPARNAQHKIVVAVDGPAASGKGTLARKLAERLGYAFLDTGALYRAVALATIEMAGDPANIDDVRPALDMIKRHITPDLLASPDLRRPEVSEGASKVAALPEVRAALLDFQREFAKNPPGDVVGVILDGRDIGTVICPDADVKFFVTASPEVRAQRRFKELQATDPSVTEESILASLTQRDARDSTRKAAPTTRAEDAYLLDTSLLTPAQVLEKAVGVMQEKFLTETA